MDLIWSILIIIAGLLLLIGGTLKSNFIIYRLMVARSKTLWGEKVHRFYQIIGLIISVFGILVAIDLI